MIVNFENFFYRNAAKVDMNVLRQKAGEVETKVNDMKNQLDEVDRMVTETMSHWLGEAGDLHRSIYKEKKPEIDRIVKDLAEHPVNLRKAADIWQGLVSETDTIIAGLPSDAIE